MPSPTLHGRASTSEFCSASDIILVHSLPCSLGSRHTTPFSKCQAYFNLGTFFFFLKCFPNISAGLTSHLSEASHSSDPMLSSQRNGKSILKSPSPFHVDFIFIFIFHYLKYPFRCQVYLFAYCSSWSEIVKSTHELALLVSPSSVLLVLRPYLTHSRCSGNEWMRHITLGLCIWELCIM